MSLRLSHPEPSAAPAAEIGRAWSRYLQETREAAPAEYAATEERAWRRLLGNLQALGSPLVEPEPAPRE